MRPLFSGTGMLKASEAEPNIRFTTIKKPKDFPSPGLSYGR
jgi:hypothetical protein